MPTLLVMHEVDDVDHWLSSNKREELFGPLGITTQVFRDPMGSNRVGLIIDVPSIDAFEEALATDAATAAMAHDGVRRDTIITLVED